MMYLIYPTEVPAKDKSKQVAASEGCTNDITHYWFSTIVSYTNPPFAALEVPDDQTDLLTPSEVSQLKDKAYMEANGWFPPFKIG